MAFFQQVAREVAVPVDVHEEVEQRAVMAFEEDGKAVEVALPDCFNEAAVRLFARVG